MKMPRRTAIAGCLLFLGLGSLAAPAAAQDEPVEMTRERMTQFARAHLAINDARDDFHGKVARVHDAEGRLRAREEVEASIEAILEEYEMTREQYDEITLRISLDGDLRALFEEILVEIEEEGAGAG